MRRESIQRNHRSCARDGCESSAQDLTALRVALARIGMGINVPLTARSRERGNIQVDQLGAKSSQPTVGLLDRFSKTEAVRRAVIGLENRIPRIPAVIVTTQLRIH